MFGKGSVKITYARTYYYLKSMNGTVNRLLFPLDADLPVIISGEKLAYMEPQEKIWQEAGRSYSFRKAYTQKKFDSLTPFEGVAGFSAQAGIYPGTLFRFPLRNTTSDLCENLYTIQKLRDLLVAIRDEAKFLLLFLRSVQEIEVYEISQYGQQTPSFKVALQEKDVIAHKRKDFMVKLKAASAQARPLPYCITRSIELVADFHVEVTDHSSHPATATTISHWLVANQVGSQNQSALDSAAKQHVFPWVGTALELNHGSSSPTSPGGHIFCFLPMPTEASCSLPVHVNGTFGLNDDRRTLKWPGTERKNDPAADWNKTLVSELLPPCYARLLMEAKKHLRPEQYYEAWPRADVVKTTTWEGILLPLFTQLFRQAVLWTEQIEALQVVGEWITTMEGSFIPKGSKVASVVRNALSRCGIKLVDIPPSIWSALSHSRTRVSEVSPSFARKQLKRKLQSYHHCDERGKLELLRYCLSDKQYRELPGLALLPLADHTFIAFDAARRKSQTRCYLCTAECPRYLLPNLDNMLVDLPHDPDLSRSLSEVADQQTTQLTKLTIDKVAELIPSAMPAEWKYQKLVTVPHGHFPSDWFQLFWQWVQKKSLHSFAGKFIIPLSHSSQKGGVSFQVTQLNVNSAVVYMSQPASPTLLAALDKLKVAYSKVADFPYLQHRQLSHYMTQFSPAGILDAITPDADPLRVSMTAEEACSLREFLSFGPSPALSQRQSTIQNLPIFATGQNSNNKLYSVTAASNLSMAVVEPENPVVSVVHLPSNLLLFTRDYHQLQLLKCLSGIVAFPSNIDFITDHLIPLIQRDVTLPNHLLDDLMQEILDMFQILVSRAPYEKRQKLVFALQSLPFLRTLSGTQKCPQELFDPSIQQLSELFKNESVFPTSPFHERRYIQHLRSCGLRTSVKPQEIVDIICAISTSADTYPQSVDSTKLSRCKAVLKYLSQCESHTLSEVVTISYQGRSYRDTFSTALKNLAKIKKWLPVCSSPPEDYPSCLGWKGSPFPSHFVSLHSSIFASTHGNFDSLSLVVGSQAYLLDYTLPSKIAQIFTTGDMLQCILAHFQEVIHCQEEIAAATITRIVRLIYQVLNKQNSQQLRVHGLDSIPEWIWIRKHNRFVSPTVVAMSQNRSFRHNLEPYIYILPDDLSQYSILFRSFGMAHSATQSQIVSVLSMIKDGAPDFECDASDASEAWQTVMSILNWLTRDGTQEPSLTEEDTLYVPVESDCQWPQLMETSEVVYTDNDFLKESLGSTDDGKTYTFVNHRIHSQMAHNLGLTPLSEHLDISEDTFEDTGQYEPLTVRLKNILKDYKDGLTIVKELLQNADDAEATEVNICYDARQHTVKPRSLFFPGMHDCHGPALVVHNNATFSNDDFTNITKLAGATKASKPLKIGKFGVGFCSVYHVTDIPSFVSQQTLCIFDPTLSYLKKEIKNPGRPGKKVKFTSRFIASSSQLAPYAGLFDFNPKEPYSGTMFRFPFRTSASELSGTMYTEATIRELITNIKNCSSKLILFLQHIKRITFSRIDQGEQTPTVLLQITKESVESISGTLTEVKKLRVLDERSSQAHEDCWLIATHTDSIDMKRATASVACLMEVTSPSQGYNVMKIEGEIFCFLPLAQKTGLPVHVSSNFAVINNRRGIWTTDEASTNDPEVQWNLSLMQNVIPKAYHTLLASLQEGHCQGKLGKYAFYSLWPLEANLTQHNPWAHAVRKLYSEAISSNKLFYSLSTSQWLTLQESKFLAPGILCQSSTDASVLDCVLAVVTHLRLPLVDLPSKYHTHLCLGSSTITEEEFVKLFFEHITFFSEIQRSRNEVLQFMLEVYAVGLDRIQTSRMDYMRDYLTYHPCIPCTPYGTQLKMCSQVVDPHTEFANLFDAEEGMFPTQQFSDRHLAKTAMMKLGMIENIPWGLVIDRAETIVELYHADRMKALERIQLILQCIESNAVGNQDKQEAKTLSAVRFLPVLKKPVDYPLPWFGEGHQLLSGKELMIKGATTYRLSLQTSETNINIAGSQVAFVNEGRIEEGGCSYINQKTREILQLQNCPSCQEVINHLKLLISKLNLKQPSPQLVKWADCICRQAYEFLDGQIQQQTSTEQASQPLDLQELQCLPCVWTGKQFVEIQAVARGWKLEGPYLYPVPSSLGFRKNLVASLEIKESFTPEDILGVLSRIKEDFNTNPVSEACQKLLRELVSSLDSINPDECCKPIMLPDTSYVMHKSTDLAFNDAPWCKPEEHYNFVHEMIPRKLALKLKVKPVRSKKLEKYVSPAELHFRGVPFGQREELTRRIQNIIREYPFDITVLKELLQNADDAKAKKMCIILDKRSHGKESVLSEEWQELQGPALLVWNDSTFTEKDLKGIQQLGLGSKRSDAESIGQYGIGVNVVYHLTDCPSFVTGGETLCIMDPHCRFVPEATPEMPGRRFDDLSSGFWDDFPDLKSAYLRGGLKDCPEELLGGSLFRFPLRHTYQLMKSSKIVDHSVSYTSHPLTADRMQHYLNQWAPKMKQALLFLNHVTELCFFVIEDHKQFVLSPAAGSYTSVPTLVLEHCFEVCINESAQQSRTQLHEKIAAFKEERGSEPCVVRYPLTITETPQTRMQQKRDTHKTEQWLIQQGIGDLQDKQQTWKYISQVKPKHGIAAPLGSQEHLGAFRGDVFCFLPLPVSCDLPVHVNAHFILNASRRNIWQSTVPGEVDDKSRWNENLLKAISSSYAKFLMEAHCHYINSGPYYDLNTLQNDSLFYYSVFPNWPKGPDGNKPAPEGQWLRLAEDVYRKLASNNASVLATIESVSSDPSVVAEAASGPVVQYTAKWHPLKNPKCQSLQIYFCAVGLDDDETSLKPILESIGMKITCAPRRIRNHFNTVQCDLPEASPSSVYNYYTRFSGQASPKDEFPCAVEATVFHSVADFKTFSQYLLLPCQTTATEEFQFPKPPFGYPLLLTADGQLRNFDEGSRVISSQYSQLFPQSLEKFLHPELLDLKYHASYFLSPSDDSDSCAIVQGILSENLPPALKTKHVPTLREHVNKSTLTSLWVCFSTKSAFSFHLETVLKCWALLPSTSNQLFSATNLLLPVVPPPDLDPPGADFSEICKILHHIGMPFLATDVVRADVVQSYCPLLSNPEDILINMYHLHQQTNVSSMITRDNVSTLIDYLKTINFIVCQEECHKCLKALPLFLTIEGSLTSLDEKTVFIWPQNACKISYSKWMSGRSVVFLDRYGDWEKLGSKSDLGIQDISAENLYIKYIFPVFSHLSEGERFKHLKHIRDRLFDKNDFIRNTKSRSYSREHKYLAQAFFEFLELLPCLGRDGEPLKCASEVCNHEKEIFTTFAEHFHFLPEIFTRNERECAEWMKFFSAIGLRESITKQEYQEFCSEVAGGRHPDPGKASSVLLQYLFPTEAVDEDDGWDTDYNFLSRISHIPFVCKESLPELRWIDGSENCILPEGIHMTKLADAALHEHSCLLWTVKPIVDLPCDDRHAHLLKSLQVTTQPSVADVTANLIAISKSRFNTFKLFDKYPQDCRPPEGAKGLVEVMLRHFEFLMSNSADCELSLLSSLSCVPVYATLKSSVVVFNERIPVVLVKPDRVLADEDAEEYYPFLHCIPTELVSVLPLLNKIGVKSSFELCHMRIALEDAFKCSDQLRLEFNTTDKVVKVIERLYTMMEQIRMSEKMGDRDIVSALKPLYLPSSEKKLVCTSNLVYHDSTNYKNCNLDHLTEADLFLLDLPITQYKFHERWFCKLLPAEIRPKGLSTCCVQTLCEGCSIVENSRLAENLKTTFGLALLPKVVLAIVKHRTNDEKLCREFEPFMLQFFQNIKVFTVDNLQTDIVLKTVQPNQILGRAKVDYHLQREGTSFNFYVNLRMGAVKSSYVFEYLADYLISDMKSMGARLELIDSELKGILKILLNSQTMEDINDVLDEETLFLDNSDAEIDANVTPTLGMPIPESWHHRLDQDINNLFHPQEWVGYEDRENHFIFAQVIHPFVEGGATSLYVLAHIHMRYKIYVSEDDEESKEVSALDLYKFLRGKEGKVRTNEGESKELVPYEGATGGSQPRPEREDVRSIKKQLCKELQDIWKLPQSEKTKAIRRLYLKWHPDKNPDRPELAEEVFKFLVNQIQRLERGLPLVDPDEQPTTGGPSPHAQREFNSRWSSYFTAWDHTARQHSRYRESENHFRARGGGDCRGGGGFAYAQFPFDEDIGPQPDPEEGQRWVKQAEVDFRTLVILLDRTLISHEVSASVCFMAHEVAEKALKGGMYAKCGLGNRSMTSHNLTPLAYALQAKEPSSTHGLAGCTIPLEPYYLDTRFPNRYPDSTTIPSEHYLPHEAQQAKVNAENILNMMKALVHS